MPCGPKCACDPGIECLAVVDPERFGFFRDWCASGDPLKREHVRRRSRIGDAPLPRVEAPPATPAMPPEEARRRARQAGERLRLVLGCDYREVLVGYDKELSCGCVDRRRCYARSADVSTGDCLLCVAGDAPG